jgi:hypothetical protein
LLKAEKGDLTGGLLPIRKAGAAFAKAYVKDLVVGVKNPRKKLEKMVACQATCADIGEELTKKARDALAAYINASEELGKQGQVAQEWVTSDAAEGINTLFMARDKLKEKFDDIRVAMNEAESAIHEQRKLRATEARNSRLDLKRIMKVFEQVNLLPNWRSAINQNGLTVDVEDPMYDESQNFSKYTASVPACAANSDIVGGNWADAKWYAPNDAGPYLHCATSLPNALS